MSTCKNHRFANAANKDCIGKELLVVYFELIRYKGEMT